MSVSHQVKIVLKESYLLHTDTARRAMKNFPVDQTRMTSYFQNFLSWFGHYVFFLLKAFSLRYGKKH